MKTVAVALTICRPTARIFLACLARQTVPLPTVLWVDDVPGFTVGELPGFVRVVDGGPLGSPMSIGLVRRAACEYAIKELGAEALLFLDDDDYYAPNHFAVTREALLSAPWTSGQRFGVSYWSQRPELCDDREGTGPQSTWGVRVGTYLAAGGYQDDRLEEVALGRRIGSEQLGPHQRVTHVRMLRGHHLSQTVSYDRAALRRRFQPVPLCAVHAPELDDLEAWCRLHDSSPLAEYHDVRS